MVNLKRLISNRGAVYSRLVVSILVLVATQSTLSQGDNPFVITHYGTGNGLPQNTVNAISQTKDGYLWFGTFNGLVRYDGIAFEEFDNQAFRDYAINRISHLIPRETSIAVAGFQQLVLFDGKTQFQTIFSPESNRNNIQKLASAEGKIWAIRARSGLSVYDGENDVIMDLPESIDVSQLQHLALDAKGLPYIATSARLFRFDGSRWISYEVPSNAVHGLAWDDFRDSVMIATPDGIFHLADEGWSRSFEFANSSVTSSESISVLAADQKGRVWIATRGNGLHWFADHGFPNQGKIQGLQSETLVSLLVDAENSVWVGTLNTGAYQIRDRSVYAYALEDTTSTDITTSVIEDLDGSILYGSRGGGLFRVVNGEVSRAGFEQTPVTALLMDSQERLWMGTAEGELWLRNSLDAQWQQEAITLTDADRRIFDIEEDRNGELWIGTTEGVIHFSADEQNLITVENGLPGTYVRDILEDREGNLWFGTQDSGLARFADGSFSIFTVDEGLATNGTWHLYEDAEGTIWAGSFGEGLSRIANGEISAHTTASGLYDDLIAAITSDGDGRLWLGSAKGLFYLDSNQSWDGSTRITSTAIGSEAGAGHQEITGGYQQNVVHDSSGNIWFTSQTGLVRIQPEIVTQNLISTQTVISEIVADGKELPIGDTVDLLAGTQNVSIDFTSPSFVSADQIEFRYRLNGFDNDWIESGVFRRASYAQLPPGNYLFEVSARRPGEEWSTESGSLTISKAFYFWQTLTFQYSLIALVFLLIAALGYGFSHLRFKQSLRRLEQEQALSNERTRIARDLHDELGSGLTHLHLLCETQSSSTSQAQSFNADAVNAKTKELVEAMDEIVWSIDPRRDNLESLVEYIVNFTETFLSAANIRCLLETLPSIPEVQVDANQRHQLLACIKEVLNNCVKHSHCERVTLSIEVMTPYYSITISDDGAGFDVTKAKHKGNGLGNLESRMVEMGGSCQITSSSESGTRVQLEWEIK